ncbi:MAG: DUF928 domain-containing protein [Cyanobacteria bacterium P01_D01_bin.156]
MTGLMVQRYKILCVLALTAVGLCIQGPAAAEVIKNAGAVNALPSSDWSFWPDDDDQAPAGTVSGASRGSCSADQLTALMPASQYGMTSKSHPEVLVATSVDIPSQALFSIQSDNDYYYETYIELPRTPGIVSIQLPAEAPALAENELYQWSLILMCNERLRPDSPSLQGWIQMQSIANIDNTQSSLEQATEYRQAHLWYDMISLLADLRIQNPTDQAVNSAWQDVLEGTELTEVANNPILK